MLPCFTYGCAQTCCWAWGFICFLAVLRPPSGSGSTGSSGYSSPLGFPTFAMGSPLWGRGLFVLDRSEGLVSPFGSGTLVSSWLDLTPLSVASLSALSLWVCCQVVLAVYELRLSFAPSIPLHCPMLGLSVASTTLATGLGLSLVPCPPFCRLGFVPRSVAQLCALQPLALSFRVVLTEAARLGWFLVLSIVLPWPWVRFQVHLLCSASCQQVVFWAWRLLIRVRLRPLPDDSLGALGLPERLL